jgi:ketosteroid isomerase-like protein
MSQENVESWKRILAAYRRGDKRAFLAEMHRDATTIPAPDFPEQGPYVGEAMWDFYVKLEDSWGESDPTLPSEIIDLGDRLLVSVERTARGRASDISVDFNFYGIATFREGKLGRVEWFRQREQALEAAGLRPSQAEPGGAE